MDIKKIMSEMTLEEKASLCSGWDFWHFKGIDRLGVPSMMVSDGPHGLRKQADAADHLGINEAIVATCFPTGVSIASSFDRALAKKVGETLGEEALAENVGTLLGPAINIKRSPLCGRNFEYFSEDPYVAGELAASYIDGVQSKEVGVSMKHFAINNQEGRRMTISSEVDERTMREIYLAPFETAVKRSHPWTIMCSYNKINGVYASENKWLLTDVLRNEWGFDGIVITDWGAINDRVEGLKAGLEIEMPSSGGKNDRKIVEAVKSGELDESVLDTACERILNIIAKYEGKTASAEYDRVKHHEIARQIATECMVLLKNDDNILPLAKDKKYAFIGAYAKAPRFQGGGSSHINTYKVDGAWEVAEDIEKVYAEGYGITDEIDDNKIKEAVKAAKESDIAIVFAGLPEHYESEGFDRKHIDMPPCQNALIEEVAKANPNTVVVLHNGSPVAMPWLDKVKGVLEVYLGGEAVGGATYDVLFGSVNPSGKLAETFPIALEDVSSSAYFPGYQKTVEYREGLYVGYRYFDKADKDVLFPFGYGLSYTNFEYSDVSLDKSEIDCNDSVTVSFKVKNVGSVAGKEVAQVYVADRESTVHRPIKELKGFEKIYLEPNEEKVVSITLDKRSFAFYNVGAHDWQVETGTFDILVGASSQDIRLATSVEVTGDATNLEDARFSLPSYYEGSVESVTDEEFEVLLGRAISPRFMGENEKLTAGNTFSDAEKTRWGRIICKLIRTFVKDSSLGGEGTMVSIILETPFRAMSNFSSGMFTDDMVDGLLMILNSDHGWKGLGKCLKGAVKIPSNHKKALKNQL